MQKQASESDIREENLNELQPQTHFGFGGGFGRFGARFGRFSVRRFGGVRRSGRLVVGQEQDVPGFFLERRATSMGIPSTIPFCEEVSLLEDMSQVPNDLEKSMRWHVRVKFALLTLVLPVGVLLLIIGLTLLLVQGGLTAGASLMLLGLLGISAGFILHVLNESRYRDSIMPQLIRIHSSADKAEECGCDTVVKLSDDSYNNTPQQTV